LWPQVPEEGILGHRSGDLGPLGLGCLLQRLALKHDAALFDVVTAVEASVRAEYFQQAQQAQPSHGGHMDARNNERHQLDVRFCSPKHRHPRHTHSDIAWGARA
jgi:hypothetical protein